MGGSQASSFFVFFLLFFFCLVGFPCSPLRGSVRNSSVARASKASAEITSGAQNSRGRSGRIRPEGPLVPPEEGFWGGKRGPLVPPEDRYLEFLGT